MKININQFNGVKLAEIESEKIVIKSTQDALDLMANCNYNESKKIIIKKENIIPDFFDLKNGIAGEILQKFSNYFVQLAVVGDFSNIKSKSLNDFIYECNKNGRINFVGSIEEARIKLTK